MAEVARSSGKSSVAGRSHGRYTRPRPADAAGKWRLPQKAVVFKTTAIDHSAIPPRRELLGILQHPPEGATTSPPSVTGSVTVESSDSLIRTRLSRNLATVT
jgi:hypothetical protein